MPCASNFAASCRSWPAEEKYSAAACVPVDARPEKSTTRVPPDWPSPGDSTVITPYRSSSPRAPRQTCRIGVEASRRRAARDLHHILLCRRRVLNRHRPVRQEELRRRTVLSPAKHHRVTVAQGGPTIWVGTTSATMAAASKRPTSTGSPAKACNSTGSTRARSVPRGAQDSKPDAIPFAMA